MTAFILDTNIISEFWKGEFANPSVRDWLARTAESNLFISVVSVTELTYGIERMDSGTRRQLLGRYLDALKDRFSTRLLAVDLRTAERCGSLRAAESLRGRSLSFPDALLAASALELHVGIATRNTVDFEGLGVRLVNPFG